VGRWLIDCFPFPGAMLKWMVQPKLLVSAAPTHSHTARSDCKDTTKVISEFGMPARNGIEGHLPGPPGHACPSQCWNFSDFSFDSILISNTCF
jgi:hypothetical protein